MHSAPAVSYPVGRSRFPGWLIACVGLSGLVVGLLWIDRVRPFSWRQGLFMVALMIAWAAAGVAWWRTRPGLLHWSGEKWRWTAFEVSVHGHSRVMLDFQDCLLVRFQTEEGRQIWLWPERRTEPAFWLGLRRGLVSAALVDRARGATDAAGREPG